MEKVRTFKHKITGKIAEQRTSYGNIDHENYVVQQFNGHLPKEFIENSNDWEEIIEKDYEILSFISNSKTIYERLDAFGSKDDYGLDGKDMYYGPLDSFLENLKNNKFNIYSIKRLSDGEVFTMGDKITNEFLMNKNYNIKSFRVGNDCLKICGSGEKGRCFITLDKNTKKVKEPLFTTENEVDIYENDNVYYINDWYPCYRSNISKSNYNPNTKYFSTKEKAEEYVLMNKPCLSINDLSIKNEIKCNEKLIGITLGKLKELVKSKL